MLGLLTKADLHISAPSAPSSLYCPCCHKQGMHPWHHPCPYVGYCASLLLDHSYHRSVLLEPSYHILNVAGPHQRCNTEDIYINNVGVVISGTSLHFNMGPQWEIYFLQSIQLGLAWHVLEASMELTTCNVAHRDVWHVPKAGCICMGLN